ncbi:MAG: CDP-alcohol phosphatidyltransferase family protein [Dongiaceae bacterium]
MLDRTMRRLIDPPLMVMAGPLAAAGVTANAVTIAGFLIGLLAIPCLSQEWYGAALALMAASRVADGLDGAVARRTNQSDFGGYLDIVCDFIFYAGFVFGFALADPGNGRAAAFLIFSFVGTGASFLTFAVMAAKRGLGTDLRGSKSLYYLGGLTEGTETIALFVAICLWPGAFVTLAYLFGALCWITTGSRILTAWRGFT